MGPGMSAKITNFTRIFSCYQKTPMAKIAKIGKIRKKRSQEGPRNAHSAGHLIWTYHSSPGISFVKNICRTLERCVGEYLVNIFSLLREDYNHSQVDIYYLGTCKT